MDIVLQKTIAGLVPANEDTEEWYRRVGVGEAVHADFKKVRNYRFLRKYFALLKVGFDNWIVPDIDTKWGKPEKNMAAFREFVTILAGYRDLVFKLDGSYKMVAKSISFARMEEEEFADLYSKTIDVLLKNVYGGDMTADKLDKVVESYLQFA